MKARTSGSRGLLAQDGVSMIPCLPGLRVGRGASGRRSVPSLALARWRGDGATRETKPPPPSCPAPCGEPPKKGLALASSRGE